MDIMLTLCAFAAPFIVYFLIKKVIVRYFENVYRKTGFNPVDTFHQIMGFIAYLPLFVCLFNPDVFENPIIMIGFPIVVTTILLFSNIKLKNPITIIVATLLQVVFGGLFVVRLVIWILMMLYSIIESIFHGFGPTITYNPFIIINMSESGCISERKNKMSFTPDPGEGLLNDLHKYTKDVDRSRNLAEKDRIEKELNEVRAQKQDAMIYGYDYAPFAMRETVLQAELDSINKKI